MIELTHNIDKFFDESREHSGISVLRTRLRALQNIPCAIAVTPDLFYAAAEIIPADELELFRLDAAGAVDISAVSGSFGRRTRAVIISTANLETGVITPVDALIPKLREITDAELIIIETAPKFADEPGVRRLRDELESTILSRFSFAHSNAPTENRLPNVSNIAFENMNGEAIAAMLFEKGFSAATGCACAEASKRPSMTLREMNVPYNRVIGSMHFSFGDEFKRYESDQFIGILTEILEKVHRFSFE